MGPLFIFNWRSRHELFSFLFFCNREKESRYGKMAMDDGGANVTPNLHLKTNQAMVCDLRWLSEPKLYKTPVHKSPSNEFVCVWEKKNGTDVRWGCKQTRKGIASKMFQEKRETQDFWFPFDSFLSSSFSGCFRFNNAQNVYISDDEHFSLLLLDKSIFLLLPSYLSWFIFIPSCFR